MKAHSLKKGVSMLLAMVMCLTTFLGIGTTTAFAAGEQADVYLVGFPRDGDANYGGEWGHGSHTFMNGWYLTITHLRGFRQKAGIRPRRKMR